MKINKGISVLLASMLIGGMLVGCSNNSNSDTTEVLTKSVKEVTKDDTEVEATKDKEKKFPPQDNNKSSEKQVNTKKDNTTTKKYTNQKETNENTTKEEPVYNEYGYDQYGNYDPNKDLYNDREWNDEDYERWDDIHDDEEPIQEDDNIDEETGLAKVKDGTHLGEEAERQDNMENTIE